MSPQRVRMIVWVASGSLLLAVALSTLLEPINDPPHRVVDSAPVVADEHPRSLTDPARIRADDATLAQAGLTPQEVDAHIQNLRYGTESTRGIALVRLLEARVRDPRILPALVDSYEIIVEQGPDFNAGYYAKLAGLQRAPEALDFVCRMIRDDQSKKLHTFGGSGSALRHIPDVFDDLSAEHPVLATLLDVAESGPPKMIDGSSLYRAVVKLADSEARSTFRDRALETSGHHGRQMGCCIVAYDPDFPSSLSDLSESQRREVLVWLGGKGSPIAGIIHADMRKAILDSKGAYARFLWELCDHDDPSVRRMVCEAADHGPIDELLDWDTTLRTRIDELRRESK